MIKIFVDSNADSLNRQGAKLCLDQKDSLRQKAQIGFGGDVTADITDTIHEC